MWFVEQSIWDTQMSGFLFFMSSNLSKILTIAFVGTAFLLVTIQAGEAQSRRVDSRSRTCAQVQSLIDQHGAVLLSTGVHTFDRYVSNRNQCQHGEVLYREFIPTKDTGRCRVQRCAEDFRFYRD
jgi:hypothetical protein